MEPTKIPCPFTGIPAGLWIDLECSWARASGTEPAVTCKRDRACLEGEGVPGGTFFLVALWRLLPWVVLGWLLSFD